MMFNRPTPIDAALPSMDDSETTPAELSALVLKAKKQWYLTYREITACLPDGADGTDRIEAVVAVLVGIGIEIFEQAPATSASGQAT